MVGGVTLIGRLPLTGPRGTPVLSRSFRGRVAGGLLGVACLGQGLFERGDHRSHDGDHGHSTMPGAELDPLGWRRGAFLPITCLSLLSLPDLSCGVLA